MLCASESHSHECLIAIGLQFAFMTNSNLATPANSNPASLADIKEVPMSYMDNDPPKTLITLLMKQTVRSKIAAVDIQQYALIAMWLCNRYGDVTNWSIPREALDWLRAESGFQEHQKVKATYIARLLLDYHADQPSEKCPEFQIVCGCGRTVSRTNSEHHRYPMYRCSCGCAVGYHKGDGWPLGLMASREVRRWRTTLHETHERLCNLWGVGVKKGYVPLAKLLGVPAHRCHFSLVVDEARAIEINAIMEQEIARLSIAKSMPRSGMREIQLAM